MEESKPKKAVKKVEDRVVNIDTRIIELYNSGFNVNQIGSMLHVHTQYIKDLLDKQ